MSKTRFIKVAAIITIIAAGLGTGAFFLQRSYQYNYADIRSVAVNTVIIDIASVCQQSFKNLFIRQVGQGHGQR